MLQMMTMTGALAGTTTTNTPVQVAFTRDPGHVGALSVVSIKGTGASCEEAAADAAVTIVGRLGSGTVPVVRWMDDEVYDDPDITCRGNKTKWTVQYEALVASPGPMPLTMEQATQLLALLPSRDAGTVKLLAPRIDFAENNGVLSVVLPGTWATTGMGTPKQAIEVYENQSVPIAAKAKAIAAILPSVQMVGIEIAPGEVDQHGVLRVHFAAEQLLADSVEWIGFELGNDALKVGDAVTTLAVGAVFKTKTSAQDVLYQPFKAEKIWEQGTPPWSKRNDNDAPPSQ